MCFMTDMSRQQMPRVRITADGGIDFEAYVVDARRERMMAQGNAFRAVRTWLREHLMPKQVRHHNERLG
jgi:hypothetical protein